MRLGEGGRKNRKKLLLLISAVANIIRKYKETGSFETGKSPGRTPQISDRDMRSLSKIAKENQCPNLRDLARKYLFKKRYKSYKAHEKPLLTVKHKKNGL
ncbi:hypothetical protein ILUMI_17424, partial [Ignelater luminosus]